MFARRFLVAASAFIIAVGFASSTARADGEEPCSDPNGCDISSWACPGPLFVPYPNGRYQNCYSLGGNDCSNCSYGCYWETGGYNIYHWNMC
jgi:hypothetical protein